MMIMLSIWMRLKMGFESISSFSENTILQIPTRVPKKPITHFHPINMTKVFAVVCFFFVNSVSLKWKV